MSDSNRSRTATEAIAAPPGRLDHGGRQPRPIQHPEEGEAKGEWGTMILSGLLVLGGLALLTWLMS